MENFPINLSDVLQYEVEQQFTREEVTFTSGTKFKLGDIIALKTGKMVLANGTDPVYGIVVSDEVDASSADAKGAVIARGPAIVSDQFLNYNSQDKATINKSLLDLGIKVVTPAFSKGE